MSGVKRGEGGTGETDRQTDERQGEKERGGVGGGMSEGGKRG